MKQNPIFKWAVFVFGFWWVFFLVFGNVVLPMLIDEWRPTLDKEAMRVQLHFWAFGMAIGSFGVIGSSQLVRQARQQRLAGKAIRGMQALIGPVPLRKDWFEQARLPRKDSVELTGAAPEDIESWREWRKANSSSHPAHVALADALMTMYEAKRDYPATHHDQGHGNRNLGAHCLAVAGRMASTASSYRYSGLRNKRGKLIAPMQRADGVNLGSHPLVYITGLAHDLGKIDGYEFKDGKVVGCAREHDLLSARMLGRLPETWDLPAEHREALLVAVGHYHHMMSFPLDSKGRVSNDLGAALMIHLHECDIQISGMETEEEYDKAEVEDLSVWEAFVEVVSEVNRINGTEKQGLVGQKWKDLIILRASLIVPAVAEKLGLNQQSEQELKVKVSDPLLLELRSRELMATQDDIQTAEFVRGEVAYSKWTDVIAIRPGKILPGLTGMMDHDPTSSVVLKGNPNKNKFDPEQTVTTTEAGSQSKVPAALQAMHDILREKEVEDAGQVKPIAMPTSDHVEQKRVQTPPIQLPEEGHDSHESATGTDAPTDAVAGSQQVARGVSVLGNSGPAATDKSNTAPGVVKPAKQDNSALAVERQVAATTPRSTPAASTAMPNEGFGMKNLSELIRQASASRGAGKESRLEAFWRTEIKRIAPSAGQVPEAALTVTVVPEQNTTPATPVPAAETGPGKTIPSFIRTAVESGAITLQVRPTGHFLFEITEGFRDEQIRKYVAGLPDGSNPDPACRLLRKDKMERDRTFMLLHRDWLSLVN